MSGANPEPEGDLTAKRDARAKAPPRPKDPLAWGRVAWALLRRPLLSGVGVLLASLTALVGVLLGSSAEALQNLVGYIPFLGGGWAVYAAVTSTEEQTRGQLPGARRTLAYAATAILVVVVSGLADVTLTIVGGMIVRTALALGPVVALVEADWPHQSLWKGLLVIDEHPKDFLKVALVAFGVALAFVLLLGLVFAELFGQAASGRLADGAARGVGSAIVAAIWTRFYLQKRAARGEP